MGLFGSGKEEKKPFKIPREISTFRMRIESEGREKYPSLVRYKEIMKDARLLYQNLDALIAKKEHAEEAARVREDIKKKLEALKEKIEMNMGKPSEQEPQDAEEKKLDSSSEMKAYTGTSMVFLEQKSMRNSAKTIFTEFLEHVESFKQFSAEGRLAHGKVIESVIPELFKAVSELNASYFKRYGDDDEIQSLKEKTLQKLAELDAVFHLNSTHFREKGLEASVETNLNKYRKK